MIEDKEKNKKYKKLADKSRRHKTNSGPASQPKQNKVKHNNLQAHKHTRKTGYVLLRIVHFK